MFALHIALYALLGTSLAFAIIELGLSAYVVSLYDTSHTELSWDAYYGYTYKAVKGDSPPILSFLVFSSVWTMLVTGVAFFLPWFYAQKNNTISSNRWIAGVLIAIYIASSVFWLACFADIASKLGGYTSGSDYLNAVIAFAVLLWLLFLALFILTILAVCGVLKSDWPGYLPFKQSTASVDTPAGAELEAAKVEANPEYR